MPFEIFDDNDIVTEITTMWRQAHEREQLLGNSSPWRFVDHVLFDLEGFYVLRSDAGELRTCQRIHHDRRIYYRDLAESLRFLRGLAEARAAMAQG